MESPQTSHRSSQLAAVTVATAVVAGCPVAVVWWLRSTEIVTSAPVAIALGMVISLALSYVGRILWETRPGSEDVLFSELMIWGYLHRMRSQRRLANVTELLAPIGDNAPATVSPRGHQRNVKLLEQLVSGLETHDPYLHGHSRRVARQSWMIARQMGLPREEVARIRTAAAIHDVGKINTPKSILHKPGRLTDAEYEVIKRHPGEGADMCEVLEDPAIVSIVRHHHERVDGSGYPQGLKGEDIPLGARIVAVADTFDAITSSRSYRAASAHKKAIDILKAEAGTRLDADVVKAFCGYYAGRGPLALWSFVAGLPERIVTWLSTGAAGVATAAKVAAVAAIVGGTTAVTAAVTPSHPKHHAAHLSVLAAAVSSPPSSTTPSASNTSSGHSGSTGGHHQSASHGRTGTPGRTVAPLVPTTKGTSTPSTTQTGSSGATSTTAAQAPVDSSPKAGGSGEQPAAETPSTPPTEASGPKAAPPKPKLEKTPTEIKREEAAQKAEEKAAKEKLKTEEKTKAEEKVKAEEATKAEEKAAKEKEKAEEKAAKEKAREEKASSGKGKGAGGKGEESPTSPSSK